MAKTKVFVGNSEHDQYMLHGQILGPGTVEVDEVDLEDFLVCIERANKDRPLKDRVNPRAVGTPAPVKLQEATLEELQTMLAIKQAEAAPPVTVPEAIVTGENTVSTTPPVTMAPVTPPVTVPPVIEPPKPVVSPVK